MATNTSKTIGQKLVSMERKVQLDLEKNRGREYWFLQGKLKSDPEYVLGALSFTCMIIIPCVMYTLGMMVGLSQWVLTQPLWTNPFKYANNIAISWGVFPMVIGILEIAVIIDWVLIPVVWIWRRFLYPTILYRYDSLAISYCKYLGSTSANIMHYR